MATRVKRRLSGGAPSRVNPRRQKIGKAGGD